MKSFLYGFGAVVIFTLVLFFFFAMGIVGRGCNHINTSVDNAVISYEEYTDIYHACAKINTDLCNMKAMPDNDASFQQFSKAQRINTLKTQLNNWVEQYNAKSKMINRSIWKSGNLPYQLNCTDFNCYN